MGKAIALELANYGSNIILHYGRSKEKAENTVNEIKDLGVEVEAYSADLFSEMEIDNLFEKINESYFDIDFRNKITDIINNMSSIIPANKTNLGLSVTSKFKLPIIINLKMKRY